MRTRARRALPRQGRSITRSTTSAAVHGCRGLQKPEVLADLAGLPAFALVRFARVPQICHFYLTFGGN